MSEATITPPSRSAATADVPLFEVPYLKLIDRPLREFGHDERWLQNLIVEDPSILGLGDLNVVQREKSQPTGGRIDLVLADFEEDLRYEVEIMLGAVDPSHIIRSIEYWDVERTRYPKLQHRAVIVAEQITSRFFNVILLLNRAVPIIAIQMGAVQIGDKMSVKFTKVLDIAELSGDDEEATVQAEPADRNYWQQHHPGLLPIMTAIAHWVPGGQPHLTYNKWHIALRTSGQNFAWFNPRKAAPFCATELRLDEASQRRWVDALLAEGIPSKTRGDRNITFQPTLEQLSEKKELIRSLLEEADKISR